NLEGLRSPSGAGRTRARADPGGAEGLRNPRRWRQLAASLDLLAISRPAAGPNRRPARLPGRCLPDRWRQMGLLISGQSESWRRPRLRGGALEFTADRAARSRARGARD